MPSVLTNSIANLPEVITPALYTHVNRGLILRTLCMYFSVQLCEKDLFSDHIIPSLIKQHTCGGCVGIHFCFWSHNAVSNSHCCSIIIIMTTPSTWSTAPLSGKVSRAIIIETNSVLLRISDVPIYIIQDLISTSLISMDSPPYHTIRTLSGSL